jgi:hypothetical protein
MRQAILLITAASVEGDIPGGKFLGGESLGSKLLDDEFIAPRLAQLGL